MMNELNPNDSCAILRCTKSCGDSGSSTCYFGEDLLIEILSRFCPKTLLRFMSVSKSWRHLISNSLTSSPVSGLLYCTKSMCNANKERGYMHLSGCCNSNCREVIESWGASLRTSDVNLTEVRYCNGLFLLYNEKDVPAAYHVCNPATNQCLALPEPPPDSNCEHPYMSLSALAFDPCKSPHYKVVRFSSKIPTYVDIFSSRVRRWIECNVHAESGIPTFSLFDMLYKDYVFMNGALHFMLQTDSLFCFHVEDVCGRTVKLPKKKKLYVSKCIGKSEGHLFYSAYDGSEMDIWMLQNFETGEWVLKHTIRKENIEKHPVAVIPNPYYKFFLSPLTFHTDLEVLFIQIQGKILAYHFDSKRNDNERLKEVSTIEIHSYINLAVPYSRCLSSLYPG